MSANPEQKRAYRRRYYAKNCNTDARLRRQLTPQQRQEREKYLLRKRQEYQQRIENNPDYIQRRREKRRAYYIAHKDWYRRYNEAHRKEVAARSAKWRRCHLEHQFESRLSRYGMTIEDYNRLLIKQNAVCAICKQPETQLDRHTKKPKRLSVDHSHAHNKVRGLLCCRCNMGLGFLEEDPARIQAAQEYLEAAATI